MTTLSIESRFESTPSRSIRDSRDFGFSGHASRVMEAALEILRQGEILLASVNDETYTRRIPVVFNGSIGGHYRHCLDHFASLLAGLGEGLIDYDHRRRDPRIETETEFALAVTRRLKNSIEAIDPYMLDAPVSARCEVSYDHGNSPVTGSTYGREFVYAIAHAIHHYALVSVIARLMNVELPSDFGVAPSTVVYRKSA